MIAQTFPWKLLTFCTHWCSPYQGYHKSEVHSQQYSLHDVIIEGVFWSFQKPLWNIWSAVCSLDDIRYVMTHPRNLEIAALSGKPNCKGLNLMSVKIFSVLSHRAYRIKIKTRGFWLMLANFPVLSSTLAVEVGLIWQQLWFVPHFGYHTIILSCFKAGWAGGRATKLVLDRLSATTNLWHHGHSSLLAYQLLMLFFFFKKKKVLA